MSENANKSIVNSIEASRGDTNENESSDSSDVSSVELPRRLRKYDKFKPETATAAEAAIQMAKLKRRRTRKRGVSLMPVKRKSAVVAEDEDNMEVANEKKLKRLKTYNIPKEKLKRAMELLDAGDPVFRPVEAPKIYNLVHAHRNTRPVTSPVRLLQEIQASIENRDFYTAVGLLRFVFRDTKRCDYQVALERLVLGILATDPVARRNKYMRNFLASSYGIAEQNQQEFLLEISRLPQSLPAKDFYNTISRYIKSELKAAAEAPSSARPKVGIKITGVYGGVNEEYVADTGVLKYEPNCFIKFEKLDV